jgi:hypothetical protein
MSTGLLWDCHMLTIRTDIDTCPLLCFAVILEGLGYFILRPVIRVAGTLEFPTRFTIADFVVLAVFLQAVLGFFVQFRGATENRETWIILLLLMCAAAVALWGAAVGFLSRAGIMNPAKRLLFLLVLLPATLALMAGLPLVVALAAMMEGRGSENGTFVVTALVGLTLVGAAATGLRFLGAWIVKGAPPRRSLPESITAPPG